MVKRNGTRPGGTTTDPAIWFEPKRYGIGIGLPVAAVGWGVMLGYAAAVLVLAAGVAPRHPALFGVAVVALTAALLAIVAPHTRGGLRWRWGAGPR